MSFGVFLYNQAESAHAKVCEVGPNIYNDIIYSTEISSCIMQSCERELDCKRLFTKKTVSVTEEMLAAVFTFAYDNMLLLDAENFLIINENNCKIVPALLSSLKSS